MKNKRTDFMPAVGGSSLLVIFAVLCLTVFSLLSLASVQADQRLQAAGVQAVADYYHGEKQAQTTLAQLRQGMVPEGVTERDGVYCYACPISQTQHLMVEVRVESSAYEILRWQAVYTADWQPDTGLPVWSGN